MIYAKELGVFCTFLSLISFNQAEKIKCEEGWKNLPSGSCVKLYSEKLSFFGAMKTCANDNSTLVTVLSRDDQIFLVNEMRTVNKTWIGLTDYGQEGTFRWVSGRKFNDTSVAFWADSSEKNERNNDCVLVQTKDPSSDAIVWNNEEGLSKVPVRLIYVKKYAFSGTSIIADDGTNLGPDKTWFRVRCDVKAAFFCGGISDSSTLTVDSLPRSKGVCPAGFFRRGNSCFKVVKGDDPNQPRLNWMDASKECQKASSDSDLVSILNFVNQEYFTALMASSYWDLWIGLRYSNNENRWAMQQDVKFKNFPTRHGKVHIGFLCTSMTIKNSDLGMWENRPCDLKLGYICESGLIPADSPSKVDTDNIEDPLLRQGKCTENFVEWQDICYQLTSAASDKMVKRATANDTCAAMNVGETLAVPRLVGGNNAGEIALLRVLMRTNGPEIEKIWLSQQARQTKEKLEFRSDDHFKTGLDYHQFINPETLKDIGKGWTCFYLTKQYQESFVHSPCDEPVAAPLCSYLLPSHPMFPKKDPFECQPGWLPFNGKCLHLFAEQKTFYEAGKTCTKAQSYPVNIYNLHKQKFIETMVTTDDVWIGLMTKSPDVYNVSNMNWKISDDKNITYLHMDVEKTFRSGPYCVVMHGTSKLWKVVECAKKKQFICEGNSKSKLKKEEPLPDCPQDFPLSFGTDCFFVSEAGSRKTWRRASDACRTIGGSLASVANRSVNTFLQSSLPSKGGLYWLGLTDMDSESDSAWNNWDDGYPVDFIYFDQKQKMNAFGGEDCVAMESDSGLWHDEHCTLKKPYMCVYHKVKKSLTRLIEPLDSDLGKQVACPKEFTHAFRNGCYKVISDKEKNWKTWKSANFYCKTLVPVNYRKRASLAAVSDEAENFFLYSLLSGYGLKDQLVNYWIGMRVIDNGVHTVTQEDARFSKVPEISSNSGDKVDNCFAMKSHQFMLGDWTNFPCQKKLPFICYTPKIPLEDIPQQPPNQNQLTCPQSYQSYLSKDGLKCYYFLTHEYTYDEATKACETHINAKYSKDNPNNLPKLISIDSSYELAYLRAQFFNKGYSIDRPIWLGLKVDSEQPDTDWRWSDGRLVYYTNWNGPPKNSKGCYAYLRKKDKMSQQGMVPYTCNQKFYAVCKVVPVSNVKKDNPKIFVHHDVNTQEGKSTKTYEGSASHKADLEGCLNSKAGVNYSGEANTTVHGWKCVRWDLIEDKNVLPNIRHRFHNSGQALSSAANLCRNPNNMRNTPFCFVSRGGKGGAQLDYCRIKSCPNYLAHLPGSHTVHSNGATVALVILLTAVLLALAGVTVFCVYKRSATGRGFIPYLRQPDSGFAASGGTSFHNPIYTPANC